VIRESAATDRAVAAGTMTMEDARAHLARVATLGAPSHLVDGITEWFATLPAESPAATDGTPVPAEPPPLPVMPQPAPPAGPTRAELQERIDAREADMRATPGSVQWQNYWMRGGAADCLTAR
jgi:hypothetical protein